jgi:hypothetical protein
MGGRGGSDFSWIVARGCCNPGIEGWDIDSSNGITPSLGRTGEWPEERGGDNVMFRSAPPVAFAPSRVFASLSVALGMRLSLGAAPVDGVGGMVDVDPFGFVSA